MVQGLGNFSGTAIKVLFQNENLVVHHHDDNNDNTSIGQILVTTPDLITGIIMNFYKIIDLTMNHAIISFLMV